MPRLAALAARHLALGRSVPGGPLAVRILRRLPELPVGGRCRACRRGVRLLL